MTLYDDFPAMDTDFPVWTGEHFRLRYLQSGDAAGLFACYHDKEAVRFMNADNCIGGFYVETPGEMQNMADWWLKGNRDCPRLTILHLPEEAPVGTAEVCGKDGGLLLLRVDIAAAYETEQALCEILGLCIDGMFALFPSYDRMWVKAIPQAVQRVAALKRCGFAGGFFFEGERGRWGDYYEIERPYRGMGYCGLVCVYCAERLGCAGCRKGGCPEKENCRPYRCGVTKEYSACGDCPDFPCTGCILDKMRIRTFAAYARDHGEETLLRHLKRNAERGICYHRNGLTGDYDGFADGKALIRFIETGEREGG